MHRPAMRRRPAVEAVPSSNPITSFTRVQKSQVLADASANKTTAGASRKRKANSSEQAISRRLSRRNISFPPSSDDDAEHVSCTKRRRRVETSLPSCKGKRVSKGRVVDSLPRHLAELVSLNKAFLNTLLLHIAQNGCSSPIDIREISPDISRTWGKRQVTIEDIRRCIAVQSYGQEDSANPLSICDYGRGRVCVEVATGDGPGINEPQLCRRFEENIRAINTQKSVDQMADVDIPLDSLSLSDLPQADIKDKASVLVSNPLMAKGQKALAVLKNDMAAKRSETSQTHNVPILNPDGTKMSLLDRLRHKELARANESASLSPAEMQRRRALGRAADVAATISALSLMERAPQSRHSFTMTRVLQVIQDSLPISKDDGMACVRLIAAEVAPRWVNVSTLGGRELVIIERSERPTPRTINETIRKLLP